MTSTQPKHAQPPSVLQAGDSSWYGEDGLWVDFWFAAPNVSINRVNGAYRLKYGTVTLHEGKPTSRYGPPKVQARRLDGSGNARGSTGGYAHAEIRFWPTSIEFPSRGCWKVTTSWRDTTVRFALQVP